ncbi:MAG: single-stranded-DNA-specific exonuclease RecJ [Bryobacterales bacterium]|nr:single-stranded-DNA-specific exonuclease RecJ [Bryobacterales bacterium]
MPTSARWIFHPAPAQDLAAFALGLGVSRPVAALLWQRGFQDAGAAGAFLNPSFGGLFDPFAFRDMLPAVDRIAKAIREGERILLYGDYDVDGTTSVAILAATLRMMGASPAHHIPHRLRDGYGIHAQVIEREAALGTKLIVSVDTGIRAAEEVLLAQRLGIDMIVTDHHLPDGQLPPAHAVLNPNRPDSTYPEKVLCGVGVTFKLIQGLLAQSGWPQAKRDRLLYSLLKLVAIGTIADVVPLTGENRTLVSLGLRGLRETSSPGLAALMQVAGFKPGELPSSGQVAFRLAPRINAAGRMADAGEVVELFLTQDPSRARAIAEMLDRLNAERQAAEKEIVSAILDECQRQPPRDSDAALVFCKPEWHRGVVGIVASRLVERYCRPVFVLGGDGDSGIAQGSGRSVRAFSLVEALETMPELFERFGGHHMAAGVTMPSSRVAEFRERLNAVAANLLKPEDFAPTLGIDATTEVADVGEVLANEVETLGPFGLGNPTPVFALLEAEIAPDPAIFAERHLRLRARKDGRFLRFTAWQFAERSQEFVPGRLMDLAFTAELDPRSAEKGYPGWVLNLKDARTARPEGRP